MTFTIDVPNALLNGDTNEIVIMRQTLEYEDPINPQKVCLLRKALYGPKQTPRS